ncbi:hypothetical protein BDW66DRAFT_148970 [Aspergillus desertorum]
MSYWQQQPPTISSGFSIAISRGANIDQRKSESGPTALLAPIRGVDPTIAQLLLQNGANPTVRKPQQPQLRWPRSSQTPLLQAARNADHSEAIIRLLRNHGAIPHGPDDCQALLLVIVRGDASSSRGPWGSVGATAGPSSNTDENSALSGQAAIVDLLLEMGDGSERASLEIVGELLPKDSGCLSPEWSGRPWRRELSAYSGRPR